MPQKICDGCSYKLEVVYDFRNTTVNAEKQLLTWLGESQGAAAIATTTPSRQPELEASQQAKSTETFVKQEEIDPSDLSKEEDDVKNYEFHEKFDEVCINLFLFKFPFIFYKLIHKLFVMFMFHFTICT